MRQSRSSGHGSQNFGNPGENTSPAPQAHAAALALATATSSNHALPEWPRNIA